MSTILGRSASVYMNQLITDVAIRHFSGLQTGSEMGETAPLVSHLVCMLAK